MHVLMLYLRDLPIGCFVLICFFGFWFLVPGFPTYLNEIGTLYDGRVMKEMWAQAAFLYFYRI